MLLALFLFARRLSGPVRGSGRKGLAQANQLMASGRFEEAIPIYRQMVKAEPGNPGCLLNLGLAQHMAGHDREAIPTLEAVLKAQPDSLPALISSARPACAESTAEAIAPLRKALAPSPPTTRRAACSPRTPRRQAPGRSRRRIPQADRRRLRRSARLVRAGHDLPGDSPRRPSSRLQKADATSPYVSALVADTRVQRRQFRSGVLLLQRSGQTVAEPARHPRGAGRCVSQDRTLRLGRRGGRQGARAALRPIARLIRRSASSPAVTTCRSSPSLAAARIARSPLLARESRQ